MFIKDFTDKELQKIRLSYPKVGEMAKLFEGNQEDNRRIIGQKTLPPVNYVKSMDKLEVLAHLVKFGYERASKMLGVSISFLKNRAAESFLSTLEDTKSLPATQDEITRPELKEIIDASSVGKLFGFKIKGDLSKEGGFSSHLGRKGELFYKELRKSRILTDFNETDTRSLYDFNDMDYGLVNVKTSKQHLYKDGSKYYKFNTSGGKSTDFYACICLNGDETPRFLVMLEFDDNEERSSFSFSLADIEEDRIKPIWKNR